MDLRVGGPPSKILLATDLSARCDRALDRAVSLAVLWNSGLVVMHVLEPERIGPGTEDSLSPARRRPADPAAAARRQLRADLGEAADRAAIVIVHGEPGEEILRAAEAGDCGLIVAGVARNELLGRFSLGATVDALLRAAPIPVLIVQERPRAPYRGIAVAVDFSEPSGRAVEVAARMFPDQKLILFHAYDVGLVGLIPDSEAYLNHCANAERECAEFLARLDLREDWLRPEIVVEHGGAAQLLRDLVPRRQIDLVVLGTRGRGALSEMFLGSGAKEILDGLPCDALVVRSPTRPGEQ